MTSDAVEITFVRHAQSVSNVTGRWQGQGDSALSEEGCRQARSFGARLAGQRYDLILCSDLSRACDTAGALGLETERSTAWREVDVGAWEGLTRAQVAERFPEEVRLLMHGAMDVRIGGAESWHDLYARVDAALAALRARLSPGARALVVTHGGVIHGLLAGVLGLRHLRPRPIGRVMNTAISTVRFHGEAVELVRFNDTAHLEPVGGWALERLEHGDTVVTVVAHVEDGEPPGAASGDALPAGRLRNAGMLELERLAGWYPAVDHLYAGAGARLRNAAAVLGARQGPALSDDPLVPAELAHLAERHPRARVGLVADALEVADFARSLLGASVRVGAPAHAAVTHVVTTPRGHSLADYNVVRARDFAREPPGDGPP